MQIRACRGEGFGIRADNAFPIFGGRRDQTEFWRGEELGEEQMELDRSCRFSVCGQVVEWEGALVDLYDEVVHGRCSSWPEE